MFPKEALLEEEQVDEDIEKICLPKMPFLEVTTVINNSMANLTK